MTPLNTRQLARLYYGVTLLRLATLLQRTAGAAPLIVAYLLAVGYRLAVYGQTLTGGTEHVEEPAEPLARKLAGLPPLQARVPAGRLGLVVDSMNRTADSLLAPGRREGILRAARDAQRGRS